MVLFKLLLTGKEDIMKTNYSIKKSRNGYKGNNYGLYDPISRRHIHIFLIGWKFKNTEKEKYVVVQAKNDEDARNVFNMYMSGLLIDSYEYVEATDISCDIAACIGDHSGVIDHGLVDLLCANDTVWIGMVEYKYNYIYAINSNILRAKEETDSCIDSLKRELINMNPATIEELNKNLKRLRKYLNGSERIEYEPEPAGIVFQGRANLSFDDDY